MNTKELAQKIDALIKAQGAETEFVEEDGSILVATTIKSKHFPSCALIFSFASDEVFSNFIPPIEIRREAFPEVCEYLMRMNNELHSGKVLIDFEKGGILFKYVKDVVSFEKAPEEVLDEMIYAPLLAMEVMIPDCLAVMNKAKTPADAAAGYEKAVEKFAAEESPDGVFGGNPSTARK